MTFQAILVIYCMYSVVTGIAGFIVGILAVPEKVAQELIDEPWKHNTPLKMSLFVFCHGVFWIIILHKMGETYDRWWDKNHDANWKKFWNKELW